MTIRRFNHPWVDESEFPILQVDFPVPVPDDEFEAYLAQLEKWTAATTERYLWVIRPVNGSAKHRKMLADAQTRRAPYEKMYCAGYAFVAESTLLRGVITAVFWLSPPPGEYAIFQEKKPALAWARERMGKLRALSL